MMLLLIACLLVGIIAYTLNQSRAEISKVQQILRELNLRDPVRNGLDSRFRDSNDDLVADLPVATVDHVDPEVIVFSFIPTRNPVHYESVFRDFCAALSEQLNRDVIYRGFVSREEQLRAIREGQVHIAGLNTGTVPLAVNVCGFVPVARLSNDKVETRYAMVIIVPADSPLQNVSDLRGKTVTFTDPSSNSGFKAPYVLLRHDFGLLPQRDYQIEFSFGHDNSIQGIADGRYQAAAVASDMLERAIGTNRVRAKDIRVIYESESFPMACIGHVHNLTPELSSKIKQTLADFRFEGTTLQSEFAAAGINRFKPVDYKNDYALIRRMDDALGRKHMLD